MQNQNYSSSIIIIQAADFLLAKTLCTMQNSARIVQTNADWCIVMQGKAG